MNMMAIDVPVQRAQVENLYVEAMLLADEAHAAFAAQRDLGSVRGNAAAQIGLACESLKTTTRLMHVIAWLLTQRAIDAGEMQPRDALDGNRRLGHAPQFDADLVAALPQRARALVEASANLHRRVGLLDAAQVDAVAPSPVQRLYDRLALAF